MSTVAPRQIPLPELPELRRKTEAVGKFLDERLRTHLETLRPLLTPEWVLGKRSGEGATATWMERHLREFRQQYEKIGQAFRLPEELDLDELSGAGGRFELHPWEYLHEARGDRETRVISFTTPARWVFSYAGEYDLSRMKRVIAGREPGQPEFVRKFVVLALLASHVVARSKAVVELLAALRYKVTVEPAADLHQLPLVVVEFALPCFRPSDNLVLTATALSGVPAFIELIDVEAVPRIPDPVRERIEALVR